jgi:initiation factor 1A
MPPNKGGKNYKKGKKGGGEGEIAMIEINGEDGQMVGRVLKSVGDRRFTVYCNDNKERLCRLCGTIRKKDWIDKGSLVLLAKRELNGKPKAVMPVTASASASASASANPDDEDLDTFTPEESKDDKLGDILQLIDPSLYGKLKRVPGINLALFNDIENQEMKHVQKRVADGIQGDDDFFDRSGDEKPTEETEGTDATEGAATGAPKAEFNPEGLRERQRDAAIKRGAEREKKEFIRLDDL